MSITLYPLDLMGRGSADIESLPSFIHRLAFHHGVSVGDIFKFIESDSGKNKKYRLRVKDLIYPSDSTLEVTTLLNSYLNDDVFGASLLPFKYCLARFSGEIVDGFRWCPECIDEMRRSGLEPYFKLIWHFKTVIYCPEHHTPFLSKCGCCGHNQEAYKKAYSPGSCCKCGELLGNRLDKEEFSFMAATNEKLSFDIQKLFVDLASADFSVLPDNGVVKSLRRVYDLSWRRKAHAELFKKFGTGEFLALVEGNKKITFVIARRIAYLLGVSLFSLFNGDAREETPLFKEVEQLDSIPCELLPKRKVQHNHKKILADLTLLLESWTIPHSLMYVANQLGLSTGYLCYRFPQISKEISYEYCEYQEREHLKKIYHAQKMALQYFVDSGSLLSRKGAYRYLREETGLPKWVLIKAITAAYLAFKK